MSASSITWAAEPLQTEVQASRALLLDEAAELVYDFTSESVTAYALPWNQSVTPGTGPVWSATGQHAPAAPLGGLALSSLPLPTPPTAADLEAAGTDEDTSPCVLATLHTQGTIHLLQVDGPKMLQQVCARLQQRVALAAA